MWWEGIGTRLHDDVLALITVGVTEFRMTPIVAYNHLLYVCSIFIFAFYQANGPGIPLSGGKRAKWLVHMATAYLVPIQRPRHGV